jgi:alkylation response protein AidB-like acyl-CoA dehydrogenase
VAGGANFDSADPAGGMQTIARRDGDEWVITGQKHYTTNGTGWDKKGCELYTVVCRTDLAAGADDALAVIAVPGSAPGITVTDVYDKIGHRGVVGCTSILWVSKIVWLVWPVRRGLSGCDVVARCGLRGGWPAGSGGW